MSIDTSTPPYFDDFDADTNYVKVLFKPGFHVQTRELNQLQTTLQNQIRQFGDNVLKQGTIVDGCQITGHSRVPYVKIGDKDSANNTITASDFVGLFGRDTSNTVGQIITSIAGSSNTDPDLNTLYVQYTNSGNSGNATSWAIGDLVTIYSETLPVSNVLVANGSAGFTNNDVVHFLPAFNVSSNTGLYIGDIVANGNTSLVITTITGTLVTGRPQIGDAVPYNANNVSLTNSMSLTNANTGAVFTVTALIGSGAAGKVVTNSVGKIVSVVMTSKGLGYTAPPTPVVETLTASQAQYQILDIASANYVAKVTVPNANSSVGYGYGVTVDEGVVYHAGYFVRSTKQFAIVSKYSNDPDNMNVGFVTTQNVITSFQDSSLNDNASGRSANAPGADRLQVTPTVAVLSSNNTPTDGTFLTIAGFSLGDLYTVDRQTQYNVIEQELAKRTAEESGNYVVDKFNLTLKSGLFADEANKFNIVVDAGLAYISGFRVKTERNYQQQVDKAKITSTVAGVAMPVSYGNYIVVTDFVGSITSATGSIVTLYDAVGVLGVGATVAAPTGNAIGQARIKAIVSSDTRMFKMYLSDIAINAGYSFSSTKSVGNANLFGNISTFDTNGIAKIFDQTNVKSVFSGPVAAIKAVSNTTFTYNKQNWGTVSSNTSGKIALVLTGAESFGVVGQLSSLMLNNLIVIPVSNVYATANLAGSFGITTGNTNLVGTSSSLLSEGVRPGTYLRVANTTANTLVRVASVANNGFLNLSANASLTISGNATIFYPKNSPVSIISANVSLDQKTMIVETFANTTSINVTVQVPVRTTVAGDAKTINRDTVIRLDLSTNINTSTGPWSLGFPGAIRLKKVYVGSNTTFTSNSVGIVDATNEFFIDSNHSLESSNLGYLFKKTKSALVLSSAQRLLVVFDHLTTTQASGLKTIGSYPINDGVVLANATTTINTLELPEIFSTTDSYVDIRDAFDFRPIVANTVAINNNQTTAPINPGDSVYATKYAGGVAVVPTPDTLITTDIEYYLPRYDRIVLNRQSAFKVLKGIPGDVTVPIEPSDSITINTLYVPQYPSLPIVMGTELAEIADTKIANEKASGRRISEYTIKTTQQPNEAGIQQPRGYKMSDIGLIDRRLADVEYYVALSLAETAAKNRQISGASGVRFKFGFFVDSFADTSLSDLAQPQYNASIINGRLVCNQTSGIVHMQADNAGSFHTLPYTSVPVVSQLAATMARVVPPTPGIVVTPPVIVPPSFNYAGAVFTSIDPPYFVSLPTNSSGSWTGPGLKSVYRYYSPSTKFTLSVVGLKPLTVHTFIIDGFDQTDHCAVVGHTPSYGVYASNPIVSDASGNATFDYYFGLHFGTTSAASDFLTYNFLQSNLSAPKGIEVTNSDQTSQAIGSIMVKPYVTSATATATSTTQAPTGGGGGSSGRTSGTNQKAN